MKTILLFLIIASFSRENFIFYKKGIFLELFPENYHKTGIRYLSIFLGIICIDITMLWHNNFKFSCKVMYFYLMFGAKCFVYLTPCIRI